MPKIELKPNSPEYNDGDPRPKSHGCDFDGCPEAGEYRAPKSRNTSDYYFFCLNHVREYNASWDFFDGMSPAQVQEEMLKSLYGDRPTWKHEGTGDPVDKLKRAAWNTYQGYHSDEGAEDEERERKRQNAFTYHHNSPEYEAMALMGLEPPLDLDIIKKRYKELAKKHHPDMNSGDEDAAERLKEINAAYTILKAAFEKYEKLVTE